MNNNLETIRIFSEDVIPVYDTDTGEKVVSGRELHERLKIKTAYKDWFPRMCEYGFVDGKDYGSFLSNRSDGLAGKPGTGVDFKVLRLSRLDIQDIINISAHGNFFSALIFHLIQNDDLCICLVCAVVSHFSGESCLIATTTQVQ